MEKTKTFILKSPIISAILTFTLAVILSIMSKLFLSSKTMGLEHTIIIIALCLAYSYGLHIKEQMSKIYRLQYSLLCTIPYLLLSIIIVLYNPAFTAIRQSYLFFITTLIPFVTITASVYFLSGFTSKKAANPQYHQRLIAQQNAPIELQNKRKLVGWLLVIFMALPLIYSNLSEKKIIQFNHETTLLLTILFLIGLSLIIKYLYDTKIK